MRLEKFAVYCVLHAIEELDYCRITRKYWMREQLICGAEKPGAVDQWKWKRESAGQMRQSNSLVEFEGEIPWLNYWVKILHASAATAGTWPFPRALRRSTRAANPLTTRPTLGSTSHGPTLLESFPGSEDRCRASSAYCLPGFPLRPRSLGE